MTTEIMGGKEREACGRCAMTSVTGMTMDGREDEEGTNRDPFGESRIEVSDDDLRRASPGVWLSGLVRRLDEVAIRLTYGRR